MWYFWIMSLFVLMWVALLPLSFYKSLISVLEYVWYLFLFLLAWILIPFLSIYNFCLVRSRGYFLDSAASLDRWGNREFRRMWNKHLIIPGGYEFGLIEETISSVLGKNQLYGTLSKTGKVLAFILDTIDKNHCFKSINHSVNW